VRSAQRVVFSDTVARAVRDGAPLVALESTIITHGLPRPENLQAALEFEAVVADHRAVPATIAMLAGVAHIGLDADRVRVIPHGIDHARFSPGDDEREPFLLYPARAWPHKNHARLYEAFALLRRQRPDEAGFDVNEGVSSVALLPSLPSEHCRGVYDPDALEGLLNRSVEYRVPSGEKNRPRILASLGRGLSGGTNISRILRSACCWRR